MKCPSCRAPVCKDPARPSKLFPFCSERCHLVDLGRWIGEEYRIPGPPADVAALAPPAASTDDD
jgi:endogenous inhibitor of DNA gyrase (YacG/DUF329 family)